MGGLQSWLGTASAPFSARLATMRSNRVPRSSSSGADHRASACGRPRPRPGRREDRAGATSRRRASRHNESRDVVPRRATPNQSRSFATRRRPLLGGTSALGESSRPAVVRRHRPSQRPSRCSSRSPPAVGPGAPRLHRVPAQGQPVVRVPCRIVAALQADGAAGVEVDDGQITSSAVCASRAASRKSSAPMRRKSK
jgi:hypothetical protein